MLMDIHGLPLSGATPDAVERFESATALLRCYLGDPVSETQAALAHAPEMTMAHVLEAYLYLLGTEPAGLPTARAAHARARVLPATPREALHVSAAGHLAHGRWRAAGRVLEDLSARYPNDLLALQVGHQIDFFTGATRMLRDRIARALPWWTDGKPGQHAVLSMLAFGLEENADYARAEEFGRRSVALEPRDGWGWHAVAHVMEMQRRAAEGVSWLSETADNWSEGSFFAMHNWWHLALFQLDLDQLDAVLELLDQRILATHSPLVLEMIDASALLWRLHLRGIDCGNRWQALAERWAAVSAESTYAFNDLHAMMAFVGAGRNSEAERLLLAQQQARQASGDNRDFLREVGSDATTAVYEFAQAHYREAQQRLRGILPVAHRFGGSHAQRDLIDLTLIEATRRSGDLALADALVCERMFVRPLPSRDAVDPARFGHPPAPVMVTNSARLN